MKVCVIYLDVTFDSAADQPQNVTIGGSLILNAWWSSFSALCANTLEHKFGHDISSNEETMMKKVTCSLDRMWSSFRKVFWFRKDIAFLSLLSLRWSGTWLSFLTGGWMIYFQKNNNCEWTRCFAGNLSAEWFCQFGIYCSIYLVWFTEADIVFQFSSFDLIDYLTLRGSHFQKVDAPLRWLKPVSTLPRDLVIRRIDTTALYH